MQDHCPFSSLPSNSKAMRSYSRVFVGLAVIAASALADQGPLRLNAAAQQYVKTHPVVMVDLPNNNHNGVATPPPALSPSDIASAPVITSDDLRLLAKVKAFMAGYQSAATGSSPSFDTMMTAYMQQSGNEKTARVRTPDSVGEAPVKAAVAPECSDDNDDEEEEDEDDDDDDDDDRRHTKLPKGSASSAGQPPVGAKAPPAGSPAPLQPFPHEQTGVPGAKIGTGATFKPQAQVGTPVPSNGQPWGGPTPAPSTNLGGYGTVTSPTPSARPASTATGSNLGGYGGPSSPMPSPMPATVPTGTNVGGFGGSSSSAPSPQMGANSPMTNLGGYGGLSSPTPSPSVTSNLGGYGGSPSPTPSTSPSPAPAMPAAPAPTSTVPGVNKHHAKKGSKVPGAPMPTTSALPSRGPAAPETTIAPPAPMQPVAKAAANSTTMTPSPTKNATQLVEEAKPIVKEAIEMKRLEDQGATGPSSSRSYSVLERSSSDSGRTARKASHDSTVSTSNSESSSTSTSPTPSPTPKPTPSPTPSPSSSPSPTPSPSSSQLTTSSSPSPSSSSTSSSSPSPAASPSPSSSNESSEGDLPPNDNGSGSSSSSSPASGGESASQESSSPADEGEGQGSTQSSSSTGNVVEEEFPEAFKPTKKPSSNAASGDQDLFPEVKPAPSKSYGESNRGDEKPIDAGSENQSSSTTDSMEESTKTPGESGTSSRSYGGY
ncbi:Uncharacterized protein PBTT_04130 [Plasmodiophora brassicae]